MRPKTIIYFEWIIFGTLLLGVLQSYLGWNRLVAFTAGAYTQPVAFILATQIITFLVIATLTLLVSRRRSKIAMWISIALFVLGLPPFIRTISSGLFLGSGAITSLQIVGELVAYGLLFTPSARHWMNRKSQSI